MLDLSSRVAIVTGAGTGIGEAIATALSRRGCAVLVNDYGTDVAGRGGEEQSRADAAATRIRKTGGTAVACAVPVGTQESAAAIIDAAMSAFGRVDILVNNAGFGDSGSLEEVNEDRWRFGLDVHLNGPRALMHLVWPHMREAGFGRIVNVASSVSFGRAGYSNFASAKAGLIGLSRAAGLEGTGAGICVNAILPTADTRATRSGLEAAGELRIRDWFIEHFPPHQVGEAVAYLCSDQCAISGDAFIVGGGRFARMGYAVAPGFFDPQISAEAVAENFGQVSDFTDADIVFDNHGEQNSYMRFIPRP
ncbi:SDR family NAD(P)-dependent oxidoreductase [Novosphingobium aquimarinum]|uniref:SDR family NAD(P)-dependent oxidoreductase n=1 Tax=Novosphingobium aquimarinum TaxID=2682494 RepID=UPI0012EC8D65|nr:SDR family NAD(P)-dependent oxidoreductase [Novosphingobium aquimarinum]